MNVCLPQNLKEVNVHFVQLKQDKPKQLKQTRQIVVAGLSVRKWVARGVAACEFQ